MENTAIKELVDQYINLTFSIEKNTAQLVKCQIGSDLTNDQHYILRYINQKEECTSSELAEVFHVKKSAITAMIERLWKKGFIQRTRDENDRRVVYLTLTAVGQELFHETELGINQLVGSLIKQFDQEEIKTFMKTYEKLNRIILATKEERLGE
ncbi:MarR family transcriptional regulator [Neobacillus sp. MM2021_6]|uniref:MarR family winged helix-turn-helix transcriptional regulator n=1 Tax=Bacillaceae TaxID=186817 RepID=UPI00140D819A|nr:MULTISPECIES: MarR family transcriptional regulator [Bacillaceae]MBO0958840.1 MarR family transcriptional regulator [Neobacillus sp. MM2021_6]NHC21472.1 MarR family transcriptional regulator [Bacillus sp. MM2020_4]